MAPIRVPMLPLPSTSSRVIRVTLPFMLNTCWLLPSGSRSMYGVR